VIRLFSALLLAALAAIALPAHAQSVPHIGQESKDSIWVPTPERMIHRMLQLADLTPNDLLIDLGSGDGRIPIYAARHFGARAIGVELERNLIEVAESSAQAAGVSHLTRFIQRDLFEADLAQASVIALYISPAVMTKLKPRLLALQPGTRIVSHQFTLEDWEADETVRTENRNGYLWVVPADVRGSWTVRTAGGLLRLRVAQKHQVLEIQGERNGRPVHVLGARLRGNDIHFTAFDPDGSARHYRGRVAGTRMEGESSGQDILPLRWAATRGPQ
jgi:precorrin-6B methylase 2